MANIEYYISKILKKARGKCLINSKVHKTSKIESGSSVVNSQIDRYSFCGYDCQIINCKIGAFCSIANNVVIGGAMHPAEWVSTSPVFYEGRDSVKRKFSIHKRNPDKTTVIEPDVWIGQNAVIKQGLIIGVGAIIGMGSVVTKNVEPYTIVAGNPAKNIRKRFDDNIIEKLIESRWWEFSDKKLFSLGKYITNPSDFINAIEI